ncbi:Hypothetical predicted protein [Olea europaea subsp. europaea]|uniref:Uncharacterized protein n=1 Tax=Olea europaea subsp. europaea TaxID=158383 RepID=A0A8S0PS36_OLEEU|nr:Hypothetical predicted protein [Olea europaea subsp. europaea]
MAEKDVVGSGISKIEHDERGREVEPQTTSKKTRHTRSKSRPPAPTDGSLEEVFLNMGERIEVVENSLSTLEAHTLEQLDDLKEDQGALREEYTRLEVKVMDAVKAIQDQVNKLCADMQSGLDACKKASTSADSHKCMKIARIWWDIRENYKPLTW